MLHKIYFVSLYEVIGKKTKSLLNFSYIILKFEKLNTRIKQQIPDQPTNQQIGRNNLQYLRIK